MKTKTLFSTILLACCGEATLTAQTYTINWFTCDGGGGISTGSGYSVRSTIGQPDAGALTGGGYTLVGGFWGVIGVVQTPGAPTLSVSRSETNTVVVSWPGPEAGWRLQATLSLATSPVVWTELSPPYASGGGQLLFIEASPNGNRYYRLHKP